MTSEPILLSSEIDVLVRMHRLRQTARNGAGWIEVKIGDSQDRFRAAIDVLVLEGLAERRCIDQSDAFGPRGWLDQWRLTMAGHSTARSYLS